jgi:hypothetical protein
MRTAVKSIHRQRQMIGWTVGAAALALAAVFAATPAKADNDRHHGGHNGYAYGHHVPPGHAKHYGHYNGYAPVYVYAPPPVVYVPRPVYYHPPQPGLTVVIPLHFD